MNNEEAGPSKITRNYFDNQDLIPKSPKLELAKKVVVYKTSYLEDIFDNSIVISNEVSMARDQLANERNWLTWFRISCTLILLGFTILIKFRLPDGNKNDTVIDQSNEPIGYTFVAIGFLCFFLGLGKYFKNQLQLVRQVTYIQAGWGSLMIVAILFCFVCTVLILASINIPNIFHNS